MLSKFVKEQIRTTVRNFANPKEEWLKGRRNRNVLIPYEQAFYGDYTEEIYNLLYYVEVLACKLEPEDQIMVFDTMKSCIAELKAKIESWGDCADGINFENYFKTDAFPAVVRMRGAKRILLAYDKNHRVCDAGLCDDVKKGLIALANKGFINIDDFAPMAKSKWLEEQMRTTVRNFANPKKEWLEGRRYWTLCDDLGYWHKQYYGDYTEEIYNLLYYVEDLACKLEPEDQIIVFLTLEKSLSEVKKLAENRYGSTRVDGLNLEEKAKDFHEDPAAVRLLGAKRILLAYAKNHRVCDEGLCDEVKQGLKNLGKSVINIDDFLPFM